MHNDAITPVVASVFLLILVTGCCTVIGLLVMQQMNAEGASNGPDVRIQPSAGSKYYLYHAGGDPLYRNTVTIYNLDTDITHRTLVNGKKDWTVWKSGEYLRSEQALADVYVIWHGGDNDRIIYQYGINRKTGIGPVADTIPD